MLRKDGHENSEILRWQEGMKMFCEKVRWVKKWENSQLFEVDNKKVEKYHFWDQLQVFYQTFIPHGIICN